MTILSVYGEKQPNGDVVITRENGEHFVTYQWWHSAKPDYRNKYVTLNCYKWRLIWKELNQ